MLGYNFLPVGSITEVLFSAGFVSSHGTSVNSNVGRFADLIKFRDAVP